MADDDTRKRVHQEDEVETSLPKRAAISATEVPDPALSEPDHHSLDEVESLQPEFQEVHCFKILCPQSITGVIIGKGGTVINHLIATTGARIKLSQTNEFFPMTTDRVLMINGSRDCLQSALTEVVTRMSEAPDRRSYHDMGRDHSDPRAHQLNLQIKVLIPKPSSSTVIGKHGAVIRRLSELSGCRFTLGDESDPYGTRERIVSVQGTSTSTLTTGVQMLMNELLEDVKNRNYANPTTNYTNLMGYTRPPPVQMNMPAPPAGSIPQHVHNGMVSMHHQQPGPGMNQPPPQPVYANSFNSGPPNNNQYMVQYQQGQMQQPQMSMHHLSSPPHNMPPQPVLGNYSPPLYPNGGHVPPMNNRQAPPVYQQPMYGSPPLMPVTPPPMPMHPQYHQPAPQFQHASQIPYGMIPENGIPRGMPPQQGQPGHMNQLQSVPPQYHPHQQQFQNRIPLQHPGQQLAHQSYNQHPQHMPSHPAAVQARPPTAPTMGYQPQQPLIHPPSHQNHVQQLQHYPPQSQQAVHGSMQFRGPSPAGEQYPSVPNSYQSYPHNSNNSFAKRAPASYATAERGGVGGMPHQNQQQQSQHQHQWTRGQRK